jgi:molecular chaperone DnaJ
MVMNSSVLLMCVMATKRSHYDILGVTPSASPEDIRTAYRRLARLHHPDVSGVDASASEMAAINSAWSVLSDPVSRFNYDRQQQTSVGASRDAREETEATNEAIRVKMTGPVRIPWRGFLFFSLLGVVGVLTLHAFSKPSGPVRPDLLLVAGSCVDIDREQFVTEVSCDGPHDGSVRQLVAFDRECPSDTMGHLDRQGMGKACVDYSPEAQGWGTQGSVGIVTVP